MAIQGTSLGGFIATTTACIDAAFDANFLMLCGGDLYDVLQHGQRDAEKLRRRFEAQGVGGDRLRDLLLTIEPLRVAHRLQPDRTWLFSGRHDTVVPLKNAIMLAKAAKLDPAHHVLYDADHYSGVSYIPEMILRVCTEFEKIRSAA